MASGVGIRTNDLMRWTLGGCLADIFMSFFRHSHFVLCKLPIFRELLLFYGGFYVAGCLLRLSSGSEFHIFPLCAGVGRSDLTSGISGGRHGGRFCLLFAAAWHARAQADRHDAAAVFGGGAAESPH